MMQVQRSELREKTRIVASAYSCSLRAADCVTLLKKGSNKFGRVKDH
jgi:hypothetical protein